MSNSKKYFWLKLKDDFFTTREVKKLRKIAGGDTYTVIYLKLQLLSIKREGLLVYEGTENNLAEQLALELDEDEDNVRVTLSFLEQNKLIEQLSQDEYLLSKVPESIGSETGAAERMRKMRENRNNVTPQLQGVTKSYTEIEIEKEIDIEREKKPKKPPRKKYGEYQHILLTEAQHAKLIKDYSVSQVEEVIKKMDEWIQLKGKPYKDFNLALRKWIREESTKGAVSGQVTGYDFSDELI